MDVIRHFDAVWDVIRLDVAKDASPTIDRLFAGNHVVIATAGNDGLIIVEDYADVWDDADLELV